LGILEGSHNETIYRTAASAAAGDLSKDFRRFGGKFRVAQFAERAEWTEDRFVAFRLPEKRLN
jgi:hypothetical protein